MADHNFTTDTYDANTAILDECKAHIAETVLPSDPASQFDDGSTLDRMAIDAINSVLGKVSQIFEGQAYMYRFAKKGVCLVDDKYAPKLDDSIGDVERLNSAIESMANLMGVKCTTNSFIGSLGYDIRGLLANTIVAIYEYNTKNLENMSQEEFDKYIDLMLDFDYNSLSAEDKARVQAVLDFLSGIDVNGNMSDSNKSKIRQYVALYEKLKEYENEKEEINNFFENSSKDGITNNDILYIKYIAYKSKGDVHKVFFSNISKCRVVSWKNSGTAFYRGVDNSDGAWGVYLDINGSDGIYDKDGSYTTFFHEIGHCIDDVMFQFNDEYDLNGKKVSSITLTNIIQANSNVNFYSALYSDTEQYFIRMVDLANSSLGWFKLNDESKRQVVEALLDGRKKWTTLNPYEKAVYDGVKSGLELTNTFRNLSVSDLVGGVTNNTVAGQSLSIPSLIATGSSGHGRNEWLLRDDYWYNGNMPTERLGKEFFAEYMSYSMTGQNSKITDMKKVFPTACNMLEKAWNTGGISYAGDGDDTKFETWLNTITSP